MKTIKQIAIVVLLCLFAVSCGGGSNKGSGESTISGSIVGEWKPVNVELKIKPKIYEKMIPKENIDNLFETYKRAGNLMLNEDKTFSYDDFSGEYEFDGKILKLIDESLPFSYAIEAMSKNKLSIDFASAYKTMIGIDLESMPGIDMKMIVNFERVK